jgi:membrane-associated phospholipid phosphatase
MQSSTLSTADDVLCFRRLLERTLLAVLVGAALVALCYFFVDRPVAFFVHDHIQRAAATRSLTLPEPIVQKWAPLVIALLLARRAFGAPTKFERALFAAMVAVILADQFRESLKTPFSRLWPDTWIHDNPSLIKNDAYGFFPFQGGEAYGSFPSGHTARAAGFFLVLWVAYPHGWLLWALCVLILASSLVAMNYHFVGDTVGGGVIGGIVGTYTAVLCGLGRRTASAS